MPPVGWRFLSGACRWKAMEQAGIEVEWPRPTAASMRRCKWLPIACPYRAQPG